MPNPLLTEEPTTSATRSKPSSTPTTAAWTSSSHTLGPHRATYRGIFPGLFNPLEAMPPDLFLVQAPYHMDAPEVFYNREEISLPAHAA
jgi:hypothetical protein